jgi:hypothetical protein
MPESDKDTYQQEASKQPSLGYISHRDQTKQINTNQASSLKAHTSTSSGNMNSKQHTNP